MAKKEYLMSTIIMARPKIRFYPITSILVIIIMLVPHL